MASNIAERRQFNDVFGPVIVAKATIDVASLADGVGATQSVTITGVALGDFVLAAFGVSLAGITVNGYASATNTVQIRVQNESGGVLDLASTTVNIVVLKPGPVFDNVIAS